MTLTCVTFIKESKKYSHNLLLPMVKKALEQLPYTIFFVDVSEKGNGLRHALKARGFRVRVFKSTVVALRAALRHVPSLFIIESDTPDEETTDVCKRIRQTAALSLLPIIFISSSDEADVVTALEAGADEYFKQPLGRRELIARIRALLRRCYELNKAKGIRFGRIETDPEAVTLKVNGVPVPVALAEFRLLEYLVRNPGRIFGRAHLLKMIRWGSRVVKPRVVDVYITRLRAKIEVDDKHPTYLRTVRGLGYCFQLPASPESEQSDVYSHEYHSASTAPR